MQNCQPQFYPPTHFLFPKFESPITSQFLQCIIFDFMPCLVYSCYCDFFPKDSSSPTHTRSSMHPQSTTIATAFYDRLGASYLLEDDGMAVLATGSCVERNARDVNLSKQSSPKRR